MKKETKVLFIILCVLLCCYALSFLHRPSRAGVFSSSLMHEQDIREVAEIRFSIPTRAEPVEMGEITLIKDGARFYLRTGNGSYPVRQEIIDRFFFAARRRPLLSPHIGTPAGLSRLPNR